MSRKDEFKTESSSPVTKYVKWKSDDKKFFFYNRDTKENELIELPYKFLVLKQLNSVGGWDDSSTSAIFANEVKYTSKEKMKVVSKGGVIAEGYYKDIKPVITAKGGHYIKVIYALEFESKEIVKITLKGSGVQSWSEFTEKAFNRLGDEWVTVKTVEEKKKGKIDYSIPVFEFDKSLDDSQGKLADKSYELLEEYINGANTRKSEAEPVVESFDDNSGLAF